MAAMTPQMPKDRLFIATIALVCLIVCIFSGFILFSIIKGKETYLSDAVTRSKAQAQMLGENASSLMYDVDVTLLLIRSMVKNQKISAGSLPDSIQQFIKTQLKFTPQADNVVIFNADKKIGYHYKELKNFEWTFFDDHRDAWSEFSIGLISTDKKEAKILMSRRLENDKGKFAGILAAVMDPSVFYDKYNDYLNIDADEIALFNTEGVVVTHWVSGAETSSEKSIGADITTLPSFSTLKGKISSGGGRRTFEDADTLVSTFQLSDFPFQIGVSYSKKNVLRNWYGETALNLGIMAVTILLLILTIAWSMAQRNRRQQAEMEVLRYQNQLEKTVEKRTHELAEANQELHKTNADLEKALSEVKALSGILPICSYCKRIRDENGNWNQLETYIHDHSEADFSHGLCPECIRKHYPDFVKDPLQTSD